MAWEIINEKLEQTNAPTLPDKTMSKPYPQALWRIEKGKNNGLPFNELMPGIKAIHVTPVKQPPYIIVYDMRTEQNSFNNHGLCILQPSECVETETLNGGWNIVLTHPMDNNGVWRYIIESNILRVDSQLFVIRKIEQTYKGSSGYVKAYAEHIFYTLNEGWIFPGSEWQGSIKNVIEKFMQYANERYLSEDIPYYLSGTSDIDKSVSKHIEENGKTIAEALLGDTGLIAKSEGFLYRDNFYFSINKETEGAIKDSFDIRVGKDLTGIRREVDLTTFVTYFRGYLSGLETWFAIAWAWSKGNAQFFRNIQQSKIFDYTALDVSPEDEFKLLQADVTAYFNSHCKPLLSYEFDLQDLSKNPAYAEFTNLPRYKVGDVGKVYDERLDVTLDLPITKVQTNHVTRRVERVWIGNTQRSFTRPINYNVDMSALGTVKPFESVGQLRDANSNKIFDANGNRIMIRKGAE